jgi:hypothetical protein
VLVTLGGMTSPFKIYSDTSNAKTPPPHYSASVQSSVLSYGRPLNCGWAWRPRGRAARTWSIYPLILDYICSQHEPLFLWPCDGGAGLSISRASFESARQDMRVSPSRCARVPDGNKRMAERRSRHARPPARQTRLEKKVRVSIISWPLRSTCIAPVLSVPVRMQASSAL